MSPIDTLWKEFIAEFRTQQHRPLAIMGQTLRERGINIWEFWACATPDLDVQLVVETGKDSYLLIWCPKTLDPRFHPDYEHGE